MESWPHPQVMLRPVQPQPLVLLTHILHPLEQIYIPDPGTIRVVQCFQVKLCNPHDLEPNLELMLVRPYNVLGVLYKIGGGFYSILERSI